jgi:hypothetical protein
MPRKVKSLMAVCFATALTLCVGGSFADTISVTNISQIPFAGGKNYNYDISFSATAQVVSGDGFVIMDFGPVGSFNFSTLDGTPPANPNTTFVLSQPSAGAPGLAGYTSSAANMDTFTGSGNVSITVPDDSTIANAVFIYNGPTFTASAGSDLQLTLFSTQTVLTPNGHGVGVDESGNSNGLNVSPTSVIVPVPEPVGLSMLGLAAMPMLMRRRSGR